MNHIENDIKVLIERYECVVVPGFGGFVSKYNPASVQPIVNTFSPPSKSVLFNMHLREDDGLLANHLCVQHKISYSTAQKQVADWKNSTLKQLEKYAEATIDGLGVFRLDSEAGMVFEAESGINLLAESYGLKTFVSPVVSVAKKEQLNRSLESTNTIQRKGFIKLRILKYGSAAAILLLVGFWTASNFYSSPDKLINQASPIAFSANEKSDDNSKAIEQESVTEATLPNVKTVNIYTESLNIQTDAISKIVKSENDNSEPHSVNNNVVEKIQPVEEKVTDLEVEKENYYIIGGSYKNRNLANRSAARYSSFGYDTTVLGPGENGRYRVSLGVYPRRCDARKDLANIRENEVKDAWLLKN